MQNSIENSKYLLTSKFSQILTFAQTYFSYFWWNKALQKQLVTYVPYSLFSLPIHLLAPFKVSTILNVLSFPYMGFIILKCMDP